MTSVVGLVVPASVLPPRKPPIKLERFLVTSPHLKISPGLPPVASNNPAHPSTQARLFSFLISSSFPNAKRRALRKTFHPTTIHPIVSAALPKFL